MAYLTGRDGAPAVATRAPAGEPQWWVAMHTLAAPALADAPAGPVAVIGPGVAPSRVAGRPVVGFGPASDEYLAGCLVGPVSDVVDIPFADLYGRLRPGGVLVALLAGGRAADDRDRVAAAAWCQGFAPTRCHPSPEGTVVVTRRGAALPPTERRTRLSVIMPAYNERATFRAAMERVMAKEIEGVDIDVIVVESNSTDGTREDVLAWAGHDRVRVILEERPRGKGHAVRRGLAEATGDFVLIQDADLEYDVDDYDKLIEPLRRGQMGFVLGRRESAGGRWRLREPGPGYRMSHLINIGHYLFLALFDVVYGQRLQDPFTMYKVFRRDCIDGLTFESNRFDFDWEITAKLIRAGYRPREIPVTYRSRSFSEGKKVRVFRDPLGWVRACIRYRFVALYDE